MQQETRTVLVGGGEIPQRVTARMLELAGGKSARLVICSLASEDPWQALHHSAQLFRERHSCANIRSFPDLSRLERQTHPKWAEEIDTVQSLAILEDCDLFYFTGGDQRRLLTIFSQSKFAQALLHRWRQGALVMAGTSAGLQIQSSLALTGDFVEQNSEDDRRDDTPLASLRRGQVIVKQGFGLMRGVILDQHFLKRQRQNRLISTLLDHPDHVGIGVDEATAIVMQGQSGSFVYPEVIGDSAVFYCDPRQAEISAQANGNWQSALDLRCGLVWEGQTLPFALELS